MSPQSAPGPNELQLLKQVERLLADPRLTPEMREELLRDAALLLDPPVMEFGPEWLKDTAPAGWVWDWDYQKLIQHHLNRIARGELKRLMLFVPPRHGKSELTTVRFSAWWIERDPTQRVIIGAYGQTLADQFSRQVRRIVSERVRLSPESKQVNDWQTINGGGVIARGVGGGVTGRGGNLIIIDDPIRGREDADSEAFREKTWDWYTNDLWTRQEPGAPIIVIQTRWHGDDLAGRLLEAQKEGGEAWEVISLPALAEANDPLGREVGAPLNPERYGVEFFETAKRLEGRNFYALYQQRPTAAEGSVYKAEWFRYYGVDGDAFIVRGARIPVSSCWTLQTVDLAASDKTSADWTVIATWTVTPSKDLLLREVRRVRKEGPEVKAEMRAQFAKHQPVFAAVDRTGLGLPIVQDLVREGYPIKGVLLHKDPYARAVGGASRYESGSIYHPEGSTWCGEYEAELLAFPNGKNDDQVQMPSLAAMVLNPTASVYSEYAPSLHQEEGDIEFDATRPLICGWAFEPALIWVATQLGRDGVWRVYCAEEGDPSQGLYAFAERIATLLREACGDLSDVQLQHGCHPDYAGFGTGKAAGGHLPWELLNKGVSAVSGYDEDGRPVHTRRTGWGWKLRGVFQSPEQREELIRTRLTTLLPGGKAALVVGPGAALVTEALLGGYEYKPLPSGGFSEKALPNKYAAVVEALGCAASLLFSAQPAKDNERAGGQGFSVARGTGRRSGM